VNENSFSFERLCIKTRFQKETQNNSEIAYSIAHEEIRYAKSYNMFKKLILFLSTDHDEGHVIDKLEVKNLFEEMDLVKQLHGS